MIPILYSKTETDFTHNGLGFLVDAEKCTVTEERNGAYELALQYPITGRYYAEIEKGSIIKAKPNETSELQLFRVYKASRPLGGSVTFSAEHISYELNGIPVLSLKMTAATPQMAMNRAFSTSPLPCRFTAWSDISTLNSINLASPCSARAVLGGQAGSILDVWGGEYEFDNFTVKLHLHRGADNGVRIDYGKNLTNLKQEENISECYTDLLPYAFYTVDDEERAVFLTEALIPLANAESYGYRRAYLMDFSGEFERDTVITEAMLRQKATAYAERTSLGVPRVSLTVSFVQLWQTEEYKNIAPLERVKLCDTVTVRYPALGVTATAKVIKTVYDVLRERYESIDIGDAKSNFADTVNGQAEEIANLAKAVVTGQAQASAELRAAIANATSLITGHSGGYVVFNPAERPQEILILDRPKLEEAVHVWRWNSGGLGYSSTGYNGTYALAMTMDGAIVADFISVGTLNGALLKADSVQATAISSSYRQSVTDSISGVETSVTQAFQAADAQLSSRITSTRTYAETLSSTAENNAKGYTDTSLEDYSTTTESEAYADSAASAAENAAKGYTDNRLTAYPTTVIMTSAINQKADEIALTVAEARTYAETLSSEAEDNAKDYTDSQLTGYATTASLTLLSNKISLVVTETQGSNVINAAGIVTAINNAGSSVVINANRVNLTAYATKSYASSISLTASNGVYSSTLTLTAPDGTTKTATVQITGMVKFSDLSTAGSTTINGANIQTGTITADKINADGIKVNTVYGIDTETGLEVPMIQTESNRFSIGYYKGTASPQVSYSLPLYVYADWHYIRSPYTDRNYEIEIDIPNGRVFLESFAIYLTRNDYIYAYNGHLYFNATKIA